MFFPIDRSNHALLSWAFRYLKLPRSWDDDPMSSLPKILDPISNLPYRGDSMLREYDAYTNFLNSLSHDARNNLLGKMKGAWRQKEYRDKQKLRAKKPCSFILSETSLGKLRGLAEGFDCSHSETLERLIDQAERKKQKKQARKNPPNI